MKLRRGVAMRDFFFPERGVLGPLPFALVVSAGILLGLLLAPSGLVQKLEWQVYDGYMRGASRQVPPPSDIAIVALDELSDAEINLPHPWPRHKHAELIDALARSGARTIALDILFQNPDGNPNGDAALAASMRAAGNVVLAENWEIIEKPGYVVKQRLSPIVELEEAATGTGVIRFPLEFDNVVRRAWLTTEGIPSLALAAAQRQEGFSLPPGDLETPRLISFSGPLGKGITTVSYYQALDPENYLPDGVFKDKIVLVGRALAAATLEDNVKDYHPTPLGPRTPGVEIHAHLLDALLRGRVIIDPFGDRRTLLLLCAAVGLAATLIVYRTGPLTGLAMTISFAFVLWITGYYLLAVFGVRVSVIGPPITFGAVYALGTSYRFALGNRERRLIKRAFTNFVAPAIVEQMLADPSRLKLGGEEYDVTVMFTDLEGFTALSERLTPGDLTDHLGTYFKEMLDLAQSERATLDKFMGDGMIIYFGCPIRDPAHPLQACRAALAMQRRMIDLNRLWAAEGLPTLRTRLGVNTGKAIAGNMGTDKIFNYTILGDTVNLASRLEGVNKEYGTLTIIGEETRAAVGDAFEMRELDRIRVKGRARPLAIYELAAPAGELPDARRELFSRFAAGLALYREMRWDESADLFRRALAIDPDDRPSRVFQSRCDLYARQSPTTAGSDGRWDGVHSMTTK